MCICSSVVTHRNENASFYATWNNIMKLKVYPCEGDKNIFPLQCTLSLQLLQYLPKKMDAADKQGVDLTEAGAGLPKYLSTLILLSNNSTFFFPKRVIFRYDL